MDVNELILEFKHIVSSNLDRRQNIVKKIETTMREENKKSVSKDKPRGFGHFLQISPEISVYVLDVETDETIRLISVPSQQDFWVVNYQIQCDITQRDNTKIDGEYFEHTFTMIDSQHKGNLVCEKGLRMFSLRLFICKSYFENPDLGVELTKIFQDSKCGNFYKADMDNKSLTILTKLMQGNYDEENFDSSLKTAVYNLVAFLIERLKGIDLDGFLILEK